MPTVNVGVKSTELARFTQLIVMNLIICYDKRAITSWRRMQNTITFNIRFDYTLLHAKFIV